jgi:hypothetical protein
MKSFQNKNAMTLVELIIWVLITSSVMIIVMTFMTTSLNELRVTNETTKTIDSIFTIKDIIARYDKWWLNTFSVYWTWWENNQFILQNWDATKWVLFWVVNNDTQKIQKIKIYGDNFIWYRLLSEKELWDILSDSGVIYDYDFHRDKIFEWVRIKDFRAELYNSWYILDIYMSTILVTDENNFWKNISELFFDKNDISEFDFTF